VNLLVVLRRVLERRPGAWTGVAIGVVGIALLATGYAVQLHAADGAIVAANEPHEIDGSGSVYLAGVLSPGDDIEQPATCTISGSGQLETVRVGIRDDRFDTIASGRRLRVDPPGTLLCDRRVSVSVGQIVNTYPLAAHRSLLAGYATLAVLGLGFAVFAVVHRRRHAAPVALAPAPAALPSLRDGIVRPGVAALFTAATVGTLGLTAVSVLVWPPAATLLMPVLLIAVALATLLSIAWSNLVDGRR
jgi:hypothetical protein